MVVVTVVRGAVVEFVGGRGVRECEMGVRAFKSRYCSLGK